MQCICQGVTFLIFISTVTKKDKMCAFHSSKIPPHNTDTKTVLVCDKPLYTFIYSNCISWIVFDSFYGI